MPSTWSHGNPVDVIGDADEHRYREAIAAVLDDPDIDAVLVMYCPTLASDPRCVAAIVEEFARTQTSKVLLTAWVGEASVVEARADLERAHVATFATPNAAISGFMTLVRYRRLQDMLLQAPPAIEEVKTCAVQEARAILNQFNEERWLPAHAVKRLLSLYGIPSNRAAMAPTPLDAKNIARGWNCRVALKVSSPDIVHKSDVGGVVLDVDPDFAEIEATKMLEVVLRHAPHAHIDGILVEEMIKRPGAHEVFLGMTSDVTFGPVLAFGHGGTGIEVINDKAFGLPPLNLHLADSMIAATRVGRLLSGYRNRPAADTGAIARALLGLSQLVTAHPQVTEIDINPLLVDERGLIAVDARIKVDPSTADSRLIISPYPRHLERTLTRRTGTPFHVRPLQPQDAALIVEFSRHLSPEAVRFRFFVPLHELDQRVAARLCQLDYDREIALVASSASADQDVMAVARFHADPDNVEAEFAVAVRSDLEGQGIGYSLMTYLKEIAAARGLQRVWGTVLADNGRMLCLAQALGMRTEPRRADNTVRVVWDLAPERS